MTSADRQYHLQCAPGDVGGYVLTPGDPGRVPRIAARLDRAREVAVNREYTTWTGELDGVPVSVTSTGIGGPSTAIAVEELFRIGAHTIVRVGTCGGMQPGQRRGDVVIAQATVRDEGTSRQYVPIEWPAVAHVEVVEALLAQARASGVRWHVGVVQSKDSFYGEMEPARMPASAELQAHWEAWTRIGVLASEMECAALFTAAATLRMRAGAVLGVVNATPLHEAMPEPGELPIDALIDVAVGAVRRLIAADRGAGG
jgi:uridine phosphorylase